MIIAINYADSSFELQRSYNTKTAYSKGKVDKVIEYSPKDIDKEFYHKNRNIFNYERGAGLWLWKPYIIQKTLLQMNEGDYLFYCDSGTYYVNKVTKLIEVMEKEKVSIMPFEIPLIQRQWTKKETFSLIGCNLYDQNQICCGYLLIKKCNEVMHLIEEWLHYMQDERCVSYKQFTNESNFNDFIEHREDQSVFSLICRKNGLVTFRDPSEYGDRPYQYAWRKASSYKEYDLVIKKYTNSPYPRIVVSNRKVNPTTYKKKEFIRNILDKMGIWECYYKYILMAKF